MTASTPKDTVKNQEKHVYSFTDALVMTGFGKFNYLFTLLCGTIAVALILETVAFSLIISSAHCDLNLSITDKGILAAVPLIGLLSTSQIWGYLADTRGRRKIVIFSLLVSSICSMLNSFSLNFIMMIALKLLSTAIISATNAILFAYYGEITPKTHVDMMISLLCSIFGAGSIVGTCIAWGILPLGFILQIPLLGITYRPWRLLCVCYALISTLASLGTYFAPESPKYLMSQGKKEEAMQILRKIYTLNTGKDVSTYLVDDILIDEQDNIGNSGEKESLLKSVWSQVAPIFKPPLLMYSFITFTISFGTLHSINPFYMWLPEMIDRFYMAVDLGDTEGKTFCELLTVKNRIVHSLVLNDTTEPLICDDSFKPNSYPLMLFLNSFLTLANIIVAIILNWVSKKLVLTTIFGLSFLSICLIHFVTDFYGAWFLMMMYQCCGPALGIVNAYIVELFPTQYRAMASSFMLMFGRIGGIVGTNVFALLIENNCSLNFSLNAIVLLVGTIVTFLLPNKIKRVENPEKNLC